jgi:nucleotide-binding universal stress UspA family protein
MNRFKNILLVNSSGPAGEAALKQVIKLARATAAGITIVEVHNSAPSPLSTYLETRRAYLDLLSESIRREHGVTVTSRLLHGRPFLEVIRLVLKDRHDLVAMAADRVQGVFSLAFGSTSMHLIRKCPCPVWVIQPEAELGFRRILAAVAPSSAIRQNPLDVKILELASSLARKENAHLDIVHAWDFTGKDLETSRSEITAAISEKLYARNETIRRASVTQLLNCVDLTDVQYSLHIEKGEPEIVIPEFARANNIGLIVLGSLRRGGVPGLLIGSSAELILRMVDCSVFTVKPDDLITPVSVEETRISLSA